MDSCGAPFSVASGKMTEVRGDVSVNQFATGTQVPSKEAGRRHEAVHTIPPACSRAPAVVDRGRSRRDHPHPDVAVFPCA
ncbi:hypothetical protein NSND_61554 [Nitrospira sp. ND1]|nr:hypothetical protein NSND_61554 [Nitrospira sp. ND1]